jgi:hypothetical protein
VNHTTKVEKGNGKVFKGVKHRELDGTTTMFNTKEAIERVAGQTIGERYWLGLPCLFGPILSQRAA